MLYRILTEDKNRQEIASIVSKRFDGFTLLAGQGYWKGLAENALAIEIESAEDNATVFALADEIKRYNKQEAVLVQTLASTATLV